MIRYAVALLLAGNIASRINAKIYEPNWASLDSRPLPKWYDEAKFGIFMHWGVYSVPSAGWTNAEWFWDEWKGYKKENYIDFMENNFKPGYSYADFASKFTAELFNPNTFAKTVQNSGARYFVFTTKHHEGFTMWPSNYSWNWNSVDTGPHRDIVGELRDAILGLQPVMGEKVHFGLYFSQFEWFNRLWLKDKENGWKTQYYSLGTSIPQMYEIINKYQPDLLWSDGDWLSPYQYWNSTEFLAWLYNQSPVRENIVTNDRWGQGMICHHGGYYTCSDRFDPGTLQAHKWENAMTLDFGTWGFRRNMVLEDVLTMDQLLLKLARTISCGGNMLLNVGPTHDGRIVPIFEERLKEMGNFLGKNSQAVFGTKPWINQNDSLNSDVWYTSALRDSSIVDPNRIFNPQDQDNTIVYSFLTRWPTGPYPSNNSIAYFGDIKPTNKTVVTMLGVVAATPFKVVGNQVNVDLSKIPWFNLPSRYAWVLKWEYLQTEDKKPKIYKGDKLVAN